MTSECGRIPYEVLDIVSRRIVNEVKGVKLIVMHYFIFIFRSFEIVQNEKKGAQLYVKK